MTAFDALSPTLNPFHSYFLEASAGTGKTFAIENLVTRLLIQTPPDAQEPLRLEEILIVTFTRAATRELRFRLRRNLNRALEALTTGHFGPFAYLDGPPEEQALAKARLTTALRDFDESQIFTLHGFCHRMLQEFPLKGKCSIGLIAPDRTQDVHRLKEVILDFLRTAVAPSEFSPGQIERLLKSYRGKIEHLVQALVIEVMAKKTLAPLPSLEETLHLFNETLIQLVQEHAPHSERLIEDFQKALSDHKKPTSSIDLSSFIKICEKGTCSLKDFDRQIRQGLPTEALLPERQDKRKKRPLSCENLSSWPFFCAVNASLLPLLQRAQSSAYTFARLAQACQNFSFAVLDEEELFSPDDFVDLLAQRLEDVDFCALIQAKYQAAIVDEFQDTDRQQWKIFKTLFGDSPGEKKRHYLYLVGDPKQSIYGFREADLYTYLQAKKALGPSAYAELTTNYRAQPNLILALNTLFKRAGTFLPLPSMGTSLDCPEAHVPAQPAMSPITDGQGSVHFFVAQKAEHTADELLFSFIAHEITRLVQEGHVRYRDCAILIRDKLQGASLEAFLRKSSLPFITQKSQPIFGSMAYTALFEIFSAIISPQNPQALRLALLGPLIGWTQDDVAALEDTVGLPEKMSALHDIFKEKGLALCFEALMASSWHADGLSLRSHLLQREQGESLYLQMTQMMDLLVDELAERRSDPEHLLEQFDLFALWEQNQDPRGTFQPNTDMDAVQILTQHTSKGLEFDVVFALGLAKRPSLRPPSLVAVRQPETAPIYIPYEEDNPHYLAMLQEEDAERMRLLYVTMTRAKRRLYLPLPILSMPAGQGDISPIERFIDKLGGLQALQVLEGEADISLSYLEAPLPLCLPSPTQKSILERPPSFKVPITYLQLQSFSSLVPHLSKGLPVKAPREPSNAALWNSKTRSQDPLPVGIETGLAFHHVMQHFPHDKACKATSAHDLICLLTPLLSNTCLKDHALFVSEKIFHLLHTPIFLSGSTLSSIPSFKMRHELFFIFPSDENLPPLEGIEFSAGFIQGFIDLLVQDHDGKYYLIDWKTNWLGDIPEDYIQENLHQAMQEHHYFVQASLYGEAVRRYLQLFDSRPFEEIFGGALYLFVRGMSQALDPACGVYHLSAHHLCPKRSA